MTITLNGTTGITTPTDTATTSVTTPLLTSPSSTSLTIQSAGTTAMTLDTSQNVGIGTTSPSNKLHVTGAGLFTGTIASNVTGTYVFYNASSSYFGAWGPNTSTNGTAIFYSARSDGSNGLETMRIDSSGNLLVGTTSTFASGAAVQNLSAYASRNSGATAGQYWKFGADGSNSFTVFNQTPTGVYVANGGTAWNAFSDERMKTNLMPIADGLNKVTSLRAVTGRYITDTEGTSRSFLIAQDVQKVLPEAVHVSDDEEKTLGLAYTEVIPLLVAAIQELSAKNDALEAHLAALEAK